MFAEWRARRLVSVGLAREFISAALIALLLFAATQFLGWAGAEAGWKYIEPLTAGQPTNQWSDFVSAAVGAIATFLGLYYATVGVVASTVYQSVPSEIRELFLRERSGRIYVTGVVHALIIGIVALVFGALDLPVRGLTLVVLALLSATAVLRLMVLGRRLFNFFDPSELSQSLPARFRGALLLASGTRSGSDEASQFVARDRAAATMRNYAQLGTLLAERPAPDGAATFVIAKQVINVLAANSTEKNSIPTDSRWWRKQVRYSNWLTMDNLQLDVSLRSSSNSVATFTPDHLWVEHKMTEVLTDVLKKTADSGGAADVLGLGDHVGALIQHQAQNFQVSESLLTLQAWGGVVAPVAARTELPPAERLAAVEFEVLPLAHLWQGFVGAVSVGGAEDVRREFLDATMSSKALYKAILPRPVIAMLEEHRTSLRGEATIEGRRITPQWFTDHYAARAMATHLREEHELVLAEVSERVPVIIGKYVEAERVDEAATAAHAALGLLDRMDHRQPEVLAAFSTLSSFRSTSIGVGSWPDTPDGSSTIVAIREGVVGVLSTLLGSLRNGTHDSESPDLYGQTYQVLLEAGFNAILNGDAAAAGIFKSLFAEADSLRQRLSADLHSRDERIRRVYSAEPLNHLMEMSGYVLLMQEVDGSGIWDDVKATWDAVLKRDGSGTTAEMLLDASEETNRLLNYTTWMRRRSKRVVQLNDVLKGRGIKTESRRFDGSKSSTSLNPVVAVFAPSNDVYGPYYELEDLFIAEYLAPLLPIGAKLPRRSEELMKALRRNREQSGAEGEVNPNV